jgi:phosphoglycolate phosphatase-like HAD superfamily hydrolase
MTLFLDLDGPLVDVSERYFRVHRDIVEQWGGRATDKAAYWERKRDRQPLPALLASGGNGHIPAADYLAQWLSRIELPAYLECDAVFPGALEQLARLGRSHRLVLVTLRQRPDHLAGELERLQLRAFFGAVLSASPTVAQGWETKQRLMGQSGFLTKTAWIVGDTEIDIRAGKGLGLTTVAVLSGIRNRAHLARERPDFLVKDIGELSQVLEAD